MRAARIGYGLRGAVVSAGLMAAVCGLVLAAPLPAGAVDEATRDELLKLNTASGVDAMQSKLTELLKDKEKAKKLVAAAATMVADAKGKDSPFNYNASLILAKAAHSTKQFETAEKFYEACAEAAAKLKSDSKLVQSYEGLMDLYTETKKFNLVEEVCQKFIDLKGGEEVDKFRPVVLEKLVQAKAKQGDIKEALRMAESLIQLDEGGWYFVQLKGWVEREAGKTDDAIDTYKESIDRIDKSKTLTDDQKARIKDGVRYVLSGLYVDANKIDEAAAHLQDLVKNHPDNPTFKNDLGFVWADHDKKLDESEKLIREALKQDKEQKEKLVADGKLDKFEPNAAYLDSLGWVLFKQKKYAEAIKYLKEAAADGDEGQHIEIHDHLADCYLATGDKKAALATLEGALKLEDVSKRDGERRRKMSEKLKALRAELKPASD